MYLRLFVDQYSNAVGVMSVKLAQGDRPAASALAHKLSGVAANLALPEVKRVAGEAQLVLTNDLDPTRVMLQLDTALERVLVEIQRYFSSTDVSH